VNYSRWNTGGPVTGECVRVRLTDCGTPNAHFVTARPRHVRDDVGLIDGVGEGRGEKMREQNYIFVFSSFERRASLIHFAQTNLLNSFEGDRGLSHATCHRFRRAVFYVDNQALESAKKV